MSTVLFASHTPECSPFRVGSHHLSAQLARLGHTVGHLSTPLSPMKALGLGDRTRLWQRWAAMLRGPVLDVDGRASAVPFTLLPLQGTAGRLGTVGLRTAVPSLAGTVRRMGLEAVDHLIIDQPLFAGLADLVPVRQVVYRPTDVYCDDRLRTAQAKVIEGADAVVGTSQVVLDSLPATARALPSLVLTNGVDAERFRRRPAAVPETSAVVYVGALDRRLDWPWLAEVARRLPDVRIDLFGPRPDGPYDLPPSVRLAGPVEYAELPALLSRYSVGLLPFRAGRDNEGRSPMKLYEYLAAGLSVVSTPHVTIEGNLPGVHVVTYPGKAAEVTDRLLAAGAANEGGVRAAEAQDWGRRTQCLLHFLTSL